MNEKGYNSENKKSHLEYVIKRINENRGFQSIIERENMEINNIKNIFKKV